MDGPGQRFDAPPAEPPSSRAAGLFWFLVFTTVGVATMAAAALLPEYAALAGAEAQCEALAHQVACEKKLAVYNERLIQAMEQDPVLVARLLIRYANYSPAGYQPVAVGPSRRGAPAPVRILEEAAHPPKPKPDPLVLAGQWLDERSTRMSLIALGLGTMTMGLMLFAGRSPDDE